MLFEFLSVPGDRTLTFALLVAESEQITAVVSTTWQCHLYNLYLKPRDGCEEHYKIPMAQLKTEALADLC